MNRGGFPTTRSSVVLALASDDSAERTRAFDALVTIYWKPLYKYARFAHHRPADEAEDLTQSFLARAFEKDWLAGYDAAKASFRTFLRVLFDRHIANEIKSASRLKRGSDQPHLDFAAAELEIARDRDRAGSPEDYFQRQWVRSVFAAAVDRLREQTNADDFAIFDAYDLDESSRLSYRDLGARFGMSEATVTNRLAAARRRFRRIVLDILRDATASEAEYRREVRALLGIDT
ncbi:MAG TPA: sigma-70 family RNA polymerase sigma factor [Thermoanaerobaculia bacterium]|nr:sigma-70 family RNA polymerase sigma factor [Thermoanaerobaculia bacterium]